jgi:hypothetical protein
MENITFQAKKSVNLKKYLQDLEKARKSFSEHNRDTDYHFDKNFTINLDSIYEQQVMENKKTIAKARAQIKKTCDCFSRCKCKKKDYSFSR